MRKAMTSWSEGDQPDIDITRYGHLEGYIWYFNEPQIVNGNPVETINFSRMILPPGAPPFEEIVKETVLTFLDPECQHEEYEGPMEFPSVN